MPTDDGEAGMSALVEAHRGDATGPPGRSATASASPRARNPSAPEHNALLPFLSTRTRLGQMAREQLETEGFMVLPGVLSAAECATALERMWLYVETVAPGVRRDEPATWFPAAAGGPDPWPHSGWKSFSDMFQSHQAGWVFTGLREVLADRVFEPLYDTRELHCSKEGFTFHRPTTHGDHPCLGRQAYVCGRLSHTAGEVRR